MAVAPSSSDVAEHIDRRILRSRQMLVDALARLLRRKDFNEISIQEITNEADLTRATFYLHFTDKGALLHTMTATRFGEMLRKRGISHVGSKSDLKAFVQGVCEYLAKVLDCQSSSDIPLERAVIPVIECIFRENAQKIQRAPGKDADTFATAAAWAIYGAAHRWAQTAHRRPSEEIAAIIESLVNPMMQSIMSPCLRQEKSKRRCAESR